MNTKSKLRNNLIRKIQQLSIAKLTEINELLKDMENTFKSKEITLSMAGSWKGLDDDIFSDLTENLHENRLNNDRPIE